MMDLFKTLLNLEKSDEIHMSRLLILLRGFAGKDGNKTLDGLTKLAKLDFLLRYPVFLERAMEERKGLPSDVNVMSHERRSIESKMVRYRYGPWDFRYRRFINILVAKGLVYVFKEGKTIKIGLTPLGFDLANRLSEEKANHSITHRVHLLKRYFNLSATSLKNFIYKTFPEIVTLRMKEEITHEY